MFNVFLMVICDMFNLLECVIAVSHSLTDFSPCSISISAGNITKILILWHFDFPSFTEVSWPILAQCFISISPEKVRKPKVFCRFQGVYKWNIGVKWVKHSFYQFLKTSSRFTSDISFWKEKLFFQKWESNFFLTCEILNGV